MKLELTLKAGTKSQTDAQAEISEAGLTLTAYGEAIGSGPVPIEKIKLDRFQLQRLCQLLDIWSAETAL